MVGVAPSGDQWTIKSGDHEAVVVEVGGGLRSYKVSGSDVVLGFSEEDLCPAGAGQILAPWPNRIRDGRYSFGGTAYQLPLTEPSTHNAIHGLVNWVRWRTVSLAPEELVVEHDLVPTPGYPWPLSLRTTWTVSRDGLRAAHEVTNVGNADCPFGFSVHPYLTVPGKTADDLLLRIPARNRLLVDGRLLPIGAARVAGGDFDYTEPRRIGTAVLDTAFGDVIRDPDGGSDVTLSTEDGQGVRLWADSAF